MQVLGPGIQGPFEPRKASGHGEFADFGFADGEAPEATRRSGRAGGAGGGEGSEGEASEGEGREVDVGLLERWMGHLKGSWRHDETCA